MSRKNVYVTASTAAEQLGFSIITLRRLAEKGRIEFLRTAGGHRRYNVNTFIANAHNNECEEETKTTCTGAIYCRVSSHKQKDDLERQIEAMQKKYPTHRVFKDIGSGLNYKRKGLQRLLESVVEGDIKQIVVAYRDRLARFGVEIIEWIIEQHGASLIVENTTVRGSEQELAEDLMAVVHVFSCRANGKRRYTKSKSSRAQENQSSEPNSKRRRATKDESSSSASEAAHASEALQT
jgi:excisionase family DNA binding protein